MYMFLSLFLYTGLNLIRCKFKNFFRTYKVFSVFFLLFSKKKELLLTLLNIFTRKK